MNMDAGKLINAGTNMQESALIIQNPELNI